MPSEGGKLLVSVDNPAQINQAQSDQRHARGREIVNTSNATDAVAHGLLHRELLVTGINVF